MSCIYCLYSTEDGRPRYVGQTTKPVGLRLAQHRREARRRRHHPLHRWINDVADRGFQVRAHALQINVPPGSLNLFERYWMGQFARLINCASGAPGPRADTVVATAVTQALRHALQAEGPTTLGIDNG